MADVVPFPSLSYPIQIGQKPLPPDWNPWRARCRARLGQEIQPGRKLTLDECRQLGFAGAASCLALAGNWENASSEERRYDWADPYGWTEQAQRRRAA